jgi:hypothetical protein
VVVVVVVVLSLWRLMMEDRFHVDYLCSLLAMILVVPASKLDE